MLGINWPRAYTNTGGHGAVRVDQSRRPARDARLQIIPGASGALFSLDGETEFPLMFTSLIEGACLPTTDDQLRATLTTMIADGFNALRIRSITNRYDTESGSNWGVWEYAESDASAVNRWAMSETMLVRLDKLIAYAFDLGMEAFWIDLEGYDDIINRHGNLRPQGTYQGRGMQWSTEYDEMAWDVNSRIFARTNTITGERYCDNVRIMWGFDNENGFSHSYERTTTNSWGGSSSMRWLAKIINEVTDPSPVVAGLGDNGYWRTELAAKWVAWVTASSYSASVGVNGSGGTWNGCIPEPAAFSALSLDSNDRNAVLDFNAQMDIDHVARIIAAVDAEAPRGNVVICTGTWIYSNPLAHTTYAASRGNLFSDTHHYLVDDGGVIGVKTGSVVSRRSIFNKAWSYVTAGLLLTDNMIGQRTTDLAYIAGEEGQYGPNGWRYERAALSAILSCRHLHPVSIHNWAQQVTTDQLLNADGHGMYSDHTNVSSQCDRLMSRCISPIVRHRFFSPVSGLFTIRATEASVLAKAHAQGSSGFTTTRFNPTYSSDGTEHSWYGDKAVVFDVDAGNTPTTDWSAFPKVTDAALSTGIYLINTATEKIHVRHDHGIQAMSPYCNWFVGEILESPVFPMALAVSGMSAAVTRAHLCIRSDGPWPLFEGPWMIFIHGSDYTTGLVERSAAYADTGGIGEAAWLSDSDQRTLYYTASNSQSWDDGPASEQRLMMPETMTIALDASGASGVFASQEQEIFKIGNDGLPTRVSTSFAGGVTSFAYDATCPVYYGHPAAKRNTSVRNRR